LKLNSLLPQALPSAGEGTVTPRNSEVFDITEAAASLGAHEQTVRRLARCGALPSFKVGKDWRFRRDALLQWIDEQRTDKRPARQP